MIQKQKRHVNDKTVRHWAGIFLALISLLVLTIQPVLAQDLLFTVPQSTADIYINVDGTASIDYMYIFDNRNNGAPIDAVDIGMPTNNYDLSSVTATINGQPVESIEDSPYVHPGIAANLGDGTIQPGQTGELNVHIGKVERMLFKANTQESEPYASFNFQPNYFSSDFVRGQTDMTVTLHLPAGLQSEEPRYFKPSNWPGAEEPEKGLDAQGNVYYRWHAADASSSEQYTFGSAFPARLVPAAALLTEVPRVNFDSDTLCLGIFCLGFAAFIGLTIYATTVGNRKRKLQYLPPRISVEGNGIKRGLTAVEAAILMEQPMDKILTMILFSVLKKGAAEVTSRNPLTIKVAGTLPEDMRTYETEFLTAMAETKQADQRRQLQDMMTNLVRSVSEKMRGFSRKETVTYYQDIMNKAWAQIEQAQTPEMKMKTFDDAMDWSMLDRRFTERTRGAFGPQPVFLPGWWWRYDPSFSRGSFSGPSVSQPSVQTSGNRPPQGVSLPNLPGADFASSMAAGMQTFASGVVGDLTAFTGGVTNKTNPAPKPTSSSSGRSGGGGSCACACACAGCACACAGGGR